MLSEAVNAKSQVTLDTMLWRMRIIKDDDLDSSNSVNLHKRRYVGLGLKG